MVFVKNVTVFPFKLSLLNEVSTTSPGKFLLLPLLRGIVGGFTEFHFNKSINLRKMTIDEEKENEKLRKKQVAEKISLFSIHLKLMVIPWNHG